MKVLLIGSGGREHSLALKLAQSPLLTQLYIAPGNPGTAQVGTNVPIADSDLEKLLTFAKDNTIDLTVVGPEGPLVQGIVDLFNQHSLAIIGPTQGAAQLEGSKKWAKEVMKKYGIPTASYRDFTQYEEALAYVKTQAYPLVIKADGLASGKGVTIAASFQEAQEALANCFIHHQFAKAGDTVVIESFLKGEEASILAFSDGKTIVPMVSAQDHKAIFDGDKGPNTGGMGTYSPAPVVTPEVEALVLETILKPLINGLRKDEIPYQGIVYAGLMIDQNKPYVVEFNARFGDPETQVVLPRLKTDLLTIFLAMANTKLHDIQIEWHPIKTVCVVLASKGYPGSFEKGKTISGAEYFSQHTHSHLIHAGTKLDHETLISNGGRVLGIVAWDESLPKAISEAYKGVDAIQFENKYYRTDIAQKALNR